MPLEPTVWNIVVVADWNPAILTPNGIVRHIFGQEQETVVDIEVALDLAHSTRVKYDGFSVRANSSRIIIDSDRPDYERLSRAAHYAVQGLQNLPVTPVHAAGINVRFNISEPPQGLLDRIAMPLDAELIAAGHTVSSRLYKRAIDFETGKINLTVRADEANPIFVELNFERTSASNKEIEEWLGLSTEKLNEATDNILTNVLGIELENTQDGQEDK